MNLRYCILPFFSVLLFSFRLFSQPIEILIPPYPENRLTYNDVWNFQVINSDKSIYVSLKIEIEEKRSGKMAQITTSDFLLNSGATAFNSASEAAAGARVFYNNNYFENTFTSSQGAPSGRYKVCIYLEAKKGIELLASKCAEQEVVQCPQPLLIYPSDESVLSEHNPLFNWTSLHPVAGDDKVSFSIHIKEILANQTKEEAMRSNMEVFAEKSMSNTMLLYPPAAKPLENGKSYCWQIRVFVNNEFCAQSEVWNFELEEPQYKKPKKDAKSYATLLRELDAGYYPLSDDTLRFRYDDSYNPGTVKYKIYNGQNQLLIGTMPALSRSPHDNFFALNLSAWSLSDGYYMLEVVTEKNERLLLRFKK